MRVPANGPRAANSYTLWDNRTYTESLILFSKANLPFKMPPRLRPRVPQDAVQTINLLMQSGIDDFSPQVVMALMDFKYRWSHNVFAEAASIRQHQDMVTRSTVRRDDAQGDARGRAAGDDSRNAALEVTVADCQLAITNLCDRSFRGPPSLDHMWELADEVRVNRWRVQSPRAGFSVSSPHYNPTVHGSLNPLCFLQPTLNFVHYPHHRSTSALFLNRPPLLSRRPSRRRHK